MPDFPLAQLSPIRLYAAGLIFRKSQFRLFWSPSSSNSFMLRFFYIFFFTSRIT